MKKLMYAMVPALILWGCYPAGPDYVEDLDVVYTTFDSEFDFKSRGTYSIPDKIVVDVDIDNGDTTYVFMKDAFAGPILAAIESEMTKYGWQKVNPLNTKPDVVITPAAIKSTTYFYSYWYDWWYGGYWGGWYGGYWGWYYPPYYTVSSYTTGSMIITMADPSAADTNPIGESPTAWVFVANGLFTGAYDLSRVTSSISKGFAQSPYLKTN